MLLSKCQTYALQSRAFASRTTVGLVARQCPGRSEGVVSLMSQSDAYRAIAEERSLQRMPAASVELSDFAVNLAPAVGIEPGHN